MLDSIRNRIRKTDDSDPCIDPDIVYDILSSSRRRAFIREIDSMETHRVPFGELVDILADPDTATERNRVCTSLYQSHIPVLDAHDIIEYDPDAKTVEPGPHLDTLAAAMRACECSL